MSDDRAPLLAASSSSSSSAQQQQTSSSTTATSAAEQPTQQAPLHETSHSPYSLFHHPLNPLASMYNPLAYYLPRRYGIATLAFLGFCNVYALRVNMSVAIVAMTKSGGEDHPADFPDWDSETQGKILSMFFYGYIVTQVPGGWVATTHPTHFPGTRLLGLGVLISSILALLTPTCTKLGGSSALMAIRVLQGLAEGVVYPAMHHVWSQWAPIEERSRLATIAFSGSYMGTVLALPISGLLSDLTGWESIFYVFGVVGLLWALFWIFTVGATPTDDKRISEDELDFIQKSISQTTPTSSSSSLHHSSSTNRPLPLRKILTSAPVWAINFAHFAENWGFYTLLTFLPRFMNDMFGMSYMSQAGVLAALPYLLLAIIVQLGGFLADHARARYLSTTNVRKLFTCGAFLIQTVFMVLAGLVGGWAGPGAAFACLTLSIGLGGLAWAGFSVNHLDIAPHHAPFLMGISNTFGTIPGMVSPYLAGKILGSAAAAIPPGGGVGVSTISQWREIFSVSAVIYMGGATLYALLASGEVQKWAGPTVAELAAEMGQ